MSRSFVSIRRAHKGSRKHQQQQQRQRIKKIKKKYIFSTPGCIKFRLSEDTRKFLHCEIDEDVNIENPWIYIKKDLFEEHIHRFEEESEFNIYKTLIQDYPFEDILVGYISNLKAEEEEEQFYICLTVEAKEAIEKYLKEMKQEQDAAMEKSVLKYSRTWHSFGSENEVSGDMNLNTRALYEVEIETRYPIISNKVQFRIRQAEDARDGYVELFCKALGVINKKLISTAVQVKPTSKNNVAQTICTYPKNMWTQYEYTFEIISTPSEEFNKSIHLFINTRFNEFEEKLHVNSFIDLYSNDYVNLVKEEKYTRTPLFLKIKEQFSFTDIDACKNKQISSISWHYFWSGILVAAYMDYALNLPVTEKSNVDEVNRIIYGINPVLIWSFADPLHPRLYLESQREISAVSCCPYDENIIVGGLVNGQIIIWDIKNRLNKVEEEEILTPAQAKYRRMLFSMLGWMLNIKNIASVRVTAVSDLLYSHKDIVTYIQWLSPEHEITKTGQIEPLPEKSPYKKSMQFASSSLDGSILFWNLHAKPATSGEYRGERKLRRLKKKPSALSVDVSPFRILNRALRPHYRLDFFQPNTNLIAPLSRFDLSQYQIKFNLVDPYIGKREYERSLYEPEVTVSSTDMKVIAVSTVGAFMEAVWEGYEYSSSPTLNNESCKYLKYIPYHDGHITSVMAYPPNTNIILTVGGKIFAVWHRNFPNKPIFWRKGKYKYMHGVWSKRSFHTIRLTRSDGNLELWDILTCSNKTVAEQSLSGSMLLRSHSQPMTIGKPVVGVVDYNGSYRMYKFPTSLMHGSAQKYEDFSRHIQKEITRKLKIANWEEEWKNKQAKNKATEENVKTAKITTEDEETKQLERELAEKEEKKKKVRDIPPGEYKQYVYEKWLEREKERMNSVLLSLKRLDPETVRKQQAPLKKIEKEKEIKKKKQRIRLQRADRIFRENVDMYFPNVLQTLPPPPLDPYASVHTDESKAACLENYEDIVKQSNEYVKVHSFRYRFQWNQVIKQGLERREFLDNAYGISKHKERFKNLKEAGDVSKSVSSTALIEEEEEEEEVKVVEEQE